MSGPEPRMRAADTDRQATVDHLARHFAAGRLTATEYDERVRQAYATTYLDELPTLLADLPDDRGAARDDASWGGGGSGRDTGGSEWTRDESGWGGEGPGWQRTPGWSGRAPGYGPAGRWYGRAGGHRRRPVAALPVILGALLLIVLTHGFILIPVFWIGLALLVFGRHRRGGCGPHLGSRLGPRSAP